MDCTLCGRPAHARGWCKAHYARWLRYGGPGPAGEIGRWAPIEVRFIDRVDLNGPIRRAELGACHIWTGAIHDSGYGTLWFKGQKVYAHRLAWWFAYGAWPGRLDHLCPTRHCVRVDHLREARTVRVRALL